MTVTKPNSSPGIPVSTSLPVKSSAFAFVAPGALKKSNPNSNEPPGSDAPGTGSEIQLATDIIALFDDVNSLEALELSRPLIAPQIKRILRTAAGLKDAGSAEDDAIDCSLPDLASLLRVLQTTRWLLCRNHESFLKEWKVRIANSSGDKLEYDKLAAALVDKKILQQEYLEAEDFENAANTESEIELAAVKLADLNQSRRYTNLWDCIPLVTGSRPTFWEMTPICRQRVYRILPYITESLLKLMDASSMSIENALVTRVAVLGEKVKHQMSNIEGLCSQEHTLETELKVVAIRKNKLETEMNEVAKEPTALINELEQQRKVVRTEIEDLRQRLKDLAGENSRLTTKIDDATAEKGNLVKKFANQTERIDNQLKGIQSHLDTIEKEKQEEVELLEKLKWEHDDSEKQLGSVRKLAQEIAGMNTEAWKQVARETEFAEEDSEIREIRSGLVMRTQSIISEKTKPYCDALANILSRDCVGDEETERRLSSLLESLRAVPSGEASRQIFSAQFQQLISSVTSAEKAGNEMSSHKEKHMQQLHSAKKKKENIQLHTIPLLQSEKLTAVDRRNFQQAAAKVKELQAANVEVEATDAEIHDLEVNLSQTENAMKNLQKVSDAAINIARIFMLEAAGGELSFMRSVNQKRRGSARTPSNQTPEISSEDNFISGEIRKWLSWWEPSINTQGVPTPYQEYFAMLKNSLVPHLNEVLSINSPGLIVPEEEEFGEGDVCEADDNKTVSPLRPDLEEVLVVEVQPAHCDPDHVENNTSCSPDTLSIPDASSVVRELEQQLEECIASEQFEKAGAVQKEIDGIFNRH